MKRFAVVAIALVTVFVACENMPMESEFESVPPATQIVDAVHNGGNEHFFFLPPLVPDPLPSGDFDATLAPVVEICELEGVGAARQCADAPTVPLIRFTSETGPGSETVRVNDVEEHYIVNWHTSDFALDVDKTYRITVLAGGTKLGHADVDLVNSGNELKNVETGEFIALKDGRTLPIKFRVEEGAVFVIGAGGGTFTAEGGNVEMSIPAGALDEEIGITVEPVTELPPDAGLIPGTVFEFGPDGTEFGQPADLTVVYEETNLPAGFVEADLVLLTEKNELWEEVPGSTVDVDANAITGLIEGFSKKGGGKRVVSVEVTPSVVDLDLGEAVQLVATPADAAGDPLNRKVTWSTSDAAIADVDGSGLVTAIGSGSAAISAKSGSATGSAEVTIAPPLDMSLSLEKTTNDLDADAAPGPTIIVGDPVRWRYKVTNTGAVTLIDVTVTDDRVGLVCGPTWLPPGAILNCIADGVATLGQYQNVGEVRARSSTTGVLLYDTDPSHYLGVAPSIPPPVPTRVSAGLSHACSITPGGQMQCWGKNNFGQLGDGTTTNRATPVVVSGGLNFESMDAFRRTCGVTPSADAYCWGVGGGAIGDGTSNSSSVPALVVSGHAFRSVSGGANHTCGITTSGEGYCWGSVSSGELGTGSQSGSLSPVLVAGGHDFIAISVGSAHTCGVTTGGQGYCWGLNSAGQLGNGTAVTPNPSVPVQVSGGLTFASVSAGGVHTCAVTTDGDAYCWGDNGSSFVGGSFGRLGDGTTTSSTVPVLVAGGHLFQSVSAHDVHSCGVTTANVAYCWGQNFEGQLGTGTTTSSTMPVTVSGGLSFEFVDTGGSFGAMFSCGYTTDGNVFCWGSNANGQLGDGSGTDSTVPVAAPGT